MSISSRVMAIDPGPQRSSCVILEDSVIVMPEILENGMMLKNLYVRRAQYPIAIEMIQSFGMPVGKEVFETVLWIGRFVEAVYPHPVALVYRKDVKMHLCGTTRAKDPNIRQALLDRFGKDATKGIKKDLWAALGVAVTHSDGERVAHGDHPHGPLDRSDVEVEDAGKGSAFERHWGAR